MTQTATQEGSQQAADNNAIRPFQVDVVPEAELIELHRRINATRWPERETVADASQGVQLATTQALARYWATEYDWRKCESRLQALPHFMTEIDGLDIHSSTSTRSTRTRCRSSLRTDGPAPWSSS
jgi:Epoxide hydrolase N terminus